jgi:hypothetical protein
VSIKWRTRECYVETLAALKKIAVCGDRQEATKNSKVRRVPMIAEAHALFERLRVSRADE